MGPADVMTPESQARLTPAGFAWYGSYRRWRPARHLLLLNRWLMDLIARRRTRIIVSMPPRHGKSTLISQYLSPWYLGTFPNNEVILTSYAASLASEFGGKARDLMEEHGPRLWDMTVKPDKRAASNWMVDGQDANGVRYEGSMRTAGVGSGITGRGGNLIIIDDPVKDAAQANSETYRNNAWEWYQSTLYSRREPDAVMICVMTRWHEDDLAGRLMTAGNEEWEYLRLPALCDSENDPLGREIGEALWPERWPRERLLEIKNDLNPYWWAALFQQEPAPPEGNILKRRWWKFWKPADRDDLPPPVVAVPGEKDHTADCITLPPLEWRAQSWDLGFKKGDHTSYVVGQEWGKRGPDAFLLDQTRSRLDFPGTVNRFLDFCDRHPEATKKWVEDKANAQALYAVLKDKVSGLVMVAVEGGDKTARAHAVSAYIQSGNVYLPHPAIAPWVHDFIEECSAFPNAKHDDQVDTMTQALRKMLGAGPSLGMTWGTR